MIQSGATAQRLAMQLPASKQFPLLKSPLTLLRKSTEQAR
jgi:hypothetical protein